MTEPTMQARAQVVDLVLAADHRHVQGHGGDDQGYDADGDIDVEDPAPARGHP